MSEYNQETDKVINKGEIIVDGIKIADYILYKSSFNMDRNYSNIDIIPNLSFEVNTNIGNSLNWNIDDYKIPDVLMALNNDWKDLKTISETLFNNIKSIYNYFKLNDDIINNVCKILNITLGEHEKELYNQDFENTWNDLFTFSKKTFINNCIYCLKNVSVFDGLTDEQIIKEIVQYYMKVFINCCIECQSDVADLY